MGEKIEVTLIDVTIAMRGRWDKVAVEGLIDDIKSEIRSKAEYINVWEEKIETKQMEVIK